MRLQLTIRRLQFDLNTPSRHLIVNSPSREIWMGYVGSEEDRPFGFEEPTAYNHGEHSARCRWFGRFYLIVTRRQRSDQRSDQAETIAA